VIKIDKYHTLIFITYFDVTYFDAKNERQASARNIIFERHGFIESIDMRFYNRYAMILKFEVSM